MGMTEEMKNLVENILQSKASRDASLSTLKENVSELREETKKFIEDIKNLRAQTSSEFARKLASERERLSKETQSMLQDLSKTREENSKALKDDLQKSLINLHSEVQAMLNNSRKLRNDMRAVLKEEFQEANSKRLQEVKELKDTTQALMQKFRDSLEEMSKTLRRSLNESSSERRASVQQMLEEIREELSKVRAELAGAAAAWREVYESKKKEVVEGVVLEDIGKRVPEEIVETDELSAKEAVVSEEEVSLETYEKGSTVEEEVDLKLKMLEIIKDHPEGISLSDIADMLGVAYVVLGRDVKSLLDEGRIRREGKFYFPV